jgi:hypothetical protein
MTDTDLRHTMHFAVARLGDRFDGVKIGIPAELDSRLFSIDAQVTSERPEERQSYVWSVIWGWAMLAGACFLAIGIAFVAGSLFGAGARRVVAALFLAAGMFCIAGSFNAMWRAFWYTPQARRRARTDGTDSERFATSMRRILPRNSSLIFQTAIALFTLVVALAS